MNFHRKRKVEATIDMTPMLDTLLQVHIAFMFLMSFAASSVKLDLPRAGASEKKTTAPVVIALNAENQMYLNNDRITLEELPTRLPPLLLTKGDRQEVILRADQTLSYKHVLKALHAVNAAGVAHVHLAYDDER